MEQNGWTRSSTPYVSASSIARNCSKVELATTRFSARFAVLHVLSSWMQTNRLSAVFRISNSTIWASILLAFSIAVRVFSGAMPAPPRWAITAMVRLAGGSGVRAGVPEKARVIRNPNTTKQVFSRDHAT